MALPGKFVLPVFFATLVLGAMVLGPLLYFALQDVFPVPFHRAMDRALLISAVVCVGLFWSRFPLSGLWPWGRDGWLQWLLGLFIAAVVVQAMLGANLALSGFTSSHLAGGKALGRIAMALAAALIVAPLEETVFRGFIQRELVQGIGLRAGLILAALIYAAAHFLKIPESLDAQPVHLWSGVTAIGAAFQPLAHGDFLSGKGIDLFILGLLLGGLFLRSGSLWIGTGVHGGFIFALLLFTGFTRPDEPPRVAFFGGDILSSFSTTLVLIITALWLWRFYRHPSVLPETGASAP